MVTGQAAPVQVGIDRKSYSVAGDLQAQTGSIGDALRNLPSVTVDVSGNVALRGDANVTILVDGKPSSLFQGDNRGQALQQLPAERIDRVEVITNPSAEFRAEGSAGIINLITKKAQGAGRTGSLRLSAGDAHRYSASGAVGFNGPKLSAASDLNLRHDTQKQENAEDRATPAPAGGGFDHAAQTQETHISADSASGRASADYDLDKATRLSGETHGNFTRFDLDGLSRFRLADGTGTTTQVFDRGLNILQHRANAELSTALRRNFAGDGHVLALNLSYEATNDDRVRSGRTHPLVPVALDGFDAQAIDNLLQRVELKGDYTRPMDGQSTLKAGFDLQRDVYSYNNRGFRGPSAAALAPDPTLTNLFDYRQTLSQAYVTYERPFGEVTVLAGLRLEDTRLDLDQVTLGHADRQAYTRLYPSLHLAWKVSDEDKLTASYSHRIQRPNPDQFNSFRFLLDPLNFRAGNPELKPQETNSYEVGFPSGATARPSCSPHLFWRANTNVVSDQIEPLGGGGVPQHPGERRAQRQRRAGGGGQRPAHQEPHLQCQRRRFLEPDRSWLAGVGGKAAGRVGLWSRGAELAGDRRRPWCS